MIFEILNIILPVIILVSIGYTWTKMGFDYPSDFVTLMIMNVGGPCLIFTGLMKISDNIKTAEMFMLASIVTILFTLIIAIIIAIILRLPKRAYIVALASTNSGNMGLPICLFAFGEVGLGLGMIFFAAAAVFQMTIYLFISHGNLSPSTLARLPLLYGLAAAAIFIYGDITPPVWLLNTTELAGGLTIPLMLLTLGVSLSKIKISQSFKSALLSLIKMSVGFGAAFLACELFGLTGMQRNVLLLQASMPVAVFSYLLAARYNRSPEEVASMVMISTLMAMITIPILLSQMI